MLRDQYPNLAWKATSWPGVQLAFLESLPNHTARVLIAMEPGCSYPAHRHVGVEEVFVVAGGYADARGRYGPGSFQRFAAGSAHHPVAGAEGALLLAWAERGIELLEAAPRGR